MKVALYCRSSTDFQENSIDMQKIMSHAVAAQRSMLIDEEYIDEAVSARSTEINDRPSLRRLLNDIRRGDVKILVVYKRDRLARNVSQHMEIYELLKEKNVQVVFTAGNELLMQYSPAGEFFELVIAGFNEREANQIALRIKDTKLARFSDGKNHSGSPPFGYFSDEEKKIQPDPEKLETVKRVFCELLMTDCSSFTGFVRCLEKKGIVPPSKSNYNRIKKWIETPEYKGVRQAKFLDEEVEIEQKRLAVLDEEVWNQAQNALKSLIRGKGPRASNKTMLDGLVLCADCRKAMKKRKIKGRMMYVCPDHYRNKVPQQRLEEWVMDQVVDRVEFLVHSEPSLLFNMSLNKLKKEIGDKFAEIEQEIKTAKDKMIRLTERWMIDKDPEMLKIMTSLYTGFSALESQKKILLSTQNAVDRYAARVKEIWSKISVRGEFEKMDERQKEDFLRDIVREIRVGQDNEVGLVLKGPIFELVSGKEGELKFAFNIDN